MYKFSDESGLVVQNDTTTGITEANSREWRKYKAWIAAGNTTEDYEPYEPRAADIAAQLKLEGVEFSGVKYSATKEDMWGLASVYQYIAAGGSVNFTFDNGNILTLTPDNYEEFWAVWVPFRQSFFE